MWNEQKKIQWKLFFFSIPDNHLPDVNHNHCCTLMQIIAGLPAGEAKREPAPLWLIGIFVFEHLNYKSKVLKKSDMDSYHWHIPLNEIHSITWMSSLFCKEVYFRYRRSELKKKMSVHQLEYDQKWIIPPLEQLQDIWFICFESPKHEHIVIVVFNYHFKWIKINWLRLKGISLSHSVIESGTKQLNCCNITWYLCMVLWLKYWKSNKKPAANPKS